VSPSLLLAILLVLIGAQAARVARPHHGAYPLLLALAALGVLGGELAALSLHAGGPPLGALHPIADAVGIGVCEGVGTALTPARRRIP
jgi:hypothetical protein